MGLSRTWFWLVLLALFACKNNKSAPVSNIPTLENPAQTFRLSHKLVEISGLSMDPTGDHLLAINDEEGLLYFLNPDDGSISGTQKFGKQGDYEGLTVVGDTVFVTKSNGTLYAFFPDRETEKIPTELSGGNDVEGLAYWPERQLLLLACKGRGAPTGKAVFGFDLRTQKLLEKPVFVIPQDSIEQFRAPAQGALEKMVDKVLPEIFAPSGIAIHPSTGEIFILSARDFSILILSPDGRFLRLIGLKRSMFPQAEGICFDAAGRLYLSTEGAGAKAKVYRFDTIEN